MASKSNTNKAKISKLTEQSPDLILEVESIAGDSDSGRRVESTTSDSVLGETETIGEEIYATETYYDDALAGESEYGSESEFEQTAGNHGSLSGNPDRPQRFTIKLLHDWCVKNKIHIDLSTIEPETLDDILCRFYTEVRSKTGQNYSRNTIMAIRYGLNRHFANMEPPRRIDIIDNNEFKSSNEVFKMVVSNAARENPERASPPISASDLRKIYSSNAVSPYTPLTLLLKVWFEISVYFNRKRSKLQRDTKITDFLFDVDSDGRRFATEIKKDDKKTHFRMYEKIGDRMCPVASLEKLLTKIDPNCQYLFQRPRLVVPDNACVWYHPERIGRNFASQMMGKISKLSDLSNRYTNVSVKKLTAWSLEELVFQHRHLVKEAESTHTLSLVQPENETPSKVHGPITACSASGISRVILPDLSARSVACNTEEQRGAFRPYVRKRTQANADKKGPEPIDVNTAKAKVKRIFQRLEYPDLVTLVDWLKRVDVLKDTSGTVFCRENCLKFTNQPESPRHFAPRQVQPLQPTQHTPYILPSPLSVSHYFMNSAVNNATCDVRPTAVYVPNFLQQKASATTQTGVVRSSNDGSLQTYPGILNAGCPQVPIVRSRQPQAIAPRPQNTGIPYKTTPTIGSFQLSTIQPSQVTSNNSVTNVAASHLSPLVNDSIASQHCAKDVTVTEDDISETSSPEKRLKISSVTGESKVWKIL